MSEKSESSRAAVLCGVGSYVPEHVVTNDDVARTLDTSDDWIRTRTGILERRRASPDEATSDLALRAGRRALQSAASDDVDAVIVATTTPDFPCPATAPDVAARLGLRGAAAFDLAAVCTGFVYALSVGGGLIANGTADRVLVIGADVYSTIIDPSDRATAPIFGDGAGAVVLRAGDPDEPGALGPAILGSDGEHRALICVPGGGSRHRAYGDPKTDDGHFFTMAGREVFRHALVRMSEASRAALGTVGWSASEVDRFVAHQANIRILDAVAERIGIPGDRTLSNIARVGNTSAASIPILLSESVANGALEPGHKVLLAAFGGGLTWGATTVTWPTSLARQCLPAGSHASIP